MESPLLALLRQKKFSWFQEAIRFNHEEADLLGISVVLHGKQLRQYKS
jgi:hypothetical protein